MHITTPPYPREMWEIRVCDARVSAFGFHEALYDSDFTEGRPTHRRAQHAAAPETEQKGNAEKCVQHRACRVSLAPISITIFNTISLLSTRTQNTLYAYSVRYMRTLMPQICV